MNENNEKKREWPKKCIWEHFTEITNDDARKEQCSGAQCNFCKQKWSQRKDSEMIAHVALFCTEPSPPKIRAKYISILHNNYEQDDNEQDNLLPNKIQSKITDHIEKSTITNEK